MLISVLKSKLYRAKVTKSSTDYSGSLGIDQAIMKQANIYPYEKILVINISTGLRFETYAIPEKEESGEFCLYGGAARLGVPGDPLIIMSFTQVPEEDAQSHHPRVVNFD